MQPKMEQPHREVFEDLIKKQENENLASIQEKERQSLINEAHGVALEENATIALAQELMGVKEKEKEYLVSPEEIEKATTYLDFSVSRIMYGDIEGLKSSVVLPQKLWEDGYKGVTKYAQNLMDVDYTLNPETLAVDWDTVPKEKLKIFYFKGKSGNISEIGKYIVDNYSTTHYVPGVEYWEYLIQNPDKAPDSLKEALKKHGAVVCFFGSIFVANPDAGERSGSIPGVALNEDGKLVASNRSSAAGWYDDVRTAILLEK